jgi:DNA polymerase V
MIVIDRADQVKDGSIVVARLNDEFVVKRFCLIDGRPWLYSANEEYEPIEVTEDTDFEIWGRVTFAITSLK